MLSILQEDLYISKNLIRVEYKIRNNSKKSIKTLVAHPLMSFHSEAPYNVDVSDFEKGKMLIAELAGELYMIARMLNPFMPATNKAIKETILSNKKPEKSCPREAGVSPATCSLF